jgi:hypothetical protein
MGGIWALMGPRLLFRQLVASARSCVRRQRCKIENTIIMKLEIIKNPFLVLDIILQANTLTLLIIFYLIFPHNLNHNNMHYYTFNTIKGYYENVLPVLFFRMCVRVGSYCLLCMGCVRWRFFLNPRELGLISDSSLCGRKKSSFLFGAGLTNIPTTL